MPERRCPICRQKFDAEKSQFLPFCSPRCKQIDLARWLDERYMLPSEREQDRPEDERLGDEEA
jgi:uncharacterized protein